MGGGDITREGIALVNEDEAFIRAIVDTPGDDTARLVYAAIDRVEVGFVIP